MDAELFRDSPAGTLVPIRGWDAELERAYDHFAYVPYELPTTVDLSQETVKLMGEADRALGGLTARIRFLPNPALLVRPALRREAQETSKLEGTYAHLDDILAADLIDPPRQSDELREVMNYVAAALRAIELIKTMPICRRLLEDIQGTLVRGTRGDGYDAGSLRQRQVFIGEKGKPVEAARFVPPPVEFLENGFSSWEKWVNADDSLPLMAKLAMSHYQFETLHPFSDGNGRVGRLIVTLQLLIAGEIDYPILNISAYLEPRREAYIDALRQVSATGNFDPWVAMFCEAVRDRSRASLEVIDMLLSYRDSVVVKAERESIKGITTEVVDVVLANPFISISEFADARKVAYNTARSLVGKLETLGVLQEVTGASYGRIWVARQVSGIISRL